MTPIKTLLHAYLDYLIATLFLLSPSLMGLSGTAEWLAYVLGCFLIVLSAVTHYPLGLFKIISFKVHGWVESILGPSLLIGHFLFRGDAAAHHFYLSISIVIILIRLTTDYAEKP